MPFKDTGKSVQYESAPPAINRRDRRDYIQLLDWMLTQNYRTELIRDDLKRDRFCARTGSPIKKARVVALLKLARSKVDVGLRELLSPDEDYRPTEDWTNVHIWLLNLEAKWNYDDES